MSDHFSEVTEEFEQRNREFMRRNGITESVHRAAVEAYKAFMNLNRQGFYHAEIAQKMFIAGYNARLKEEVERSEF